ncbi:UNVERIFIED_CONTAM: Chloride conductance regulatory protein ICln [Sesamum radiatum]|uniref:Chloride conductance regulatory protein ICln n=1 Tax=Sesamum radiatum TaxID=300843 RepID=A0AAW2KBE3_SESRA
MATGLRLVTQRVGDGAGQPVLDADNGEELMHVQPGVSIVLWNRPPESPGTLYISTKQVVWLSDTDRAKGYAVDFVSVSLHAVSRDPEAYPSPCIYTQIENGAEELESEDSDSESDDRLNLSKITEMRLVPSDPNQSEGDDGHNWVFSADQLEDDGAGAYLIMRPPSI